MVPAASMGDYVVQPTTTQQDAKLDGEVAQVTQQFEELGERLSVVMVSLTAC